MSLIQRHEKGGEAGAVVRLGAARAIDYRVRRLLQTLAEGTEMRRADESGLQLIPLVCRQALLVKEVAAVGKGAAKERYQPRTCGTGSSGAACNASIQAIPLSSRNQNMSSDRRSRRFGECYSSSRIERIPLRVEAAVAASSTANTRSGPLTLRT